MPKHVETNIQYHRPTDMPEIGNKTPISPWRHYLGIFHTTRAFACLCEGWFPHSARCRIFKVRDSPRRNLHALPLYLKLRQPIGSSCLERKDTTRLRNRQDTRHDTNGTDKTTSTLTERQDRQGTEDDKTRYGLWCQRSIFIISQWKHIWIYWRERSMRICSQCITCFRCM